MSHVDLDQKIRSIKDTLCLIETEESWDRIAAALHSLKALLHEDGSLQTDYYANLLRTLSSPLNKHIGSERSRLSGAALDTTTAAATELGQSFETLLPVFLPTLLTLCGRPNKVFVARARACITAIIESTQSPQILSHLLRYTKDKSTTLRLAVAEATLACLQSFNPPDLQRDARAQEIEGLIKSTATDANADIRKVGRRIFEAYSILLPNRVDRFIDPLTPTTKRYLAVTARTASEAPPNPPSRPSSSMSTRSALTSSQSSYRTAESTKPVRSVKRGEASTDPTRPPRSQCFTTEAPMVAGPSRAPSRQAYDTERNARRPASRAENVHANADAMPPPSVVPPRAHGDAPLRAQDFSSAVPSSRSITPSNPPRPRTGPIRPTAPVQPGTSAPTHTGREQGQADQKPLANGARRVLRPDSAMSTQSGPEETKSVGSTSRIAPIRAEDSSKSLAPSDRRLQEKDVTAAKPSRVASKTVASKPKATAHADGAVKQPSKAVVKQETRSSRAASKPIPEERRPPNTTTVRSQALLRTNSQPKMTRQEKSAVASKPKPKPMLNKRVTVTTVRRAMSPALVPLPHSPAESRSQSPAAVRSLVSEENRPQAALQRPPSPPSPELPSETDHDECNLSEDSTVVLDPATPQGQARAAEHHMLVQQTPISALVDSIQRGFMFTPSADSLSTVDEDVYDESSVLYEPRAELVTWDCKPLVLSKTS